MIATWMMYCSLCALGLTLAAALTERLLLAGRAPVRMVWTSALLLSIALPIVVFKVSSSQRPAAAPITAATSNRPTPLVESAATIAPATTPAPIAAPKQPAFVWRTTVAQLDEPLLIAWVVLSTALALSLISGIVALAFMRRRWQRGEVHGVPVYISRRTGPAVVGAVSPAIVVPEWALSLEQAQLALMLRHEREHLAARDGQLLLAAQIALIAMPWNAALWWQVLSLRVAIEMDCDARVLRVADARSYGELLLEVARPHRTFKLAGMMAFAERATQLERRIRVLKRHRFATPRRATIAAASITLLAVTAAAAAPHPTAPTHTETRAPLLVKSASRSAPIHDVVMSAPIVTSNAKLVTSAPSRRSTRPIVAMPKLVGCENDTTVVGATYRFLFDGVALTRDNQSQACTLLARLADEQLAEDAVAQATMLDTRARRIAIQSNRDADLASLLKTDADRAAFAGNSSKLIAVGGAVGGRGRSGGGDAFAGPGGAPPGRVMMARGGFTGDTIINLQARDTLLVKMKQDIEATIRARADAGATATGAAGGVITPMSFKTDTAGRDPQISRLVGEMKMTMAAVAGAGTEQTYARLFAGIDLSPDDAAAAHKIIADAQEQMTSVAPVIRPVVRLRVNRARGVVQMSAGADAPLIELGSTAADREKIRSRIITVPQ